MNNQSIYFVGTREEIAHHAAPIIGCGLGRQYRIAVATSAEVLDNSQPGDLAVFYSEHFDRFRHACAELKKRNVGTLYMIDGILEWRNAWENRVDEPASPFAMRPVLAHKVACIGSAQARVVGSWGNEEKVEVVGIPRLDSIDQVANSKLNRDEFRVLVMSAKCPGFTDEQIETTKESLVDLKNWFAIHPQFRGRRIVPVWRLTNDLDAVIGVENQLKDLAGADLLAALSGVDAVITTPSTAMLEAMLMQKPVALLDYHLAPKYVSAAWEINHRAQIDEVLDQLIDPPPARMEYQCHVLSENLHGADSSTGRMSELMRIMLESAREQLEQPGQTLRFGPDLLPPVASQMTWRQSELYPEYEEFRNSDLVQTQTELAQARREIVFLNRELDQARSELSEAHSIFEQIESHPIAGPIVRARQKMLDWVASARRPSKHRA